ncbi:hypothetical protein ACFQ9X_19240 [Catenulispora yoronensis]
MRAVVEWGWRLLTEQERELARWFAVFVGGGTAEAVGRVAGDGSSMLAALVDKSFVAWDGARYRMLETIRAYVAEDAVAAGVLRVAARRHAEYFTRLAEESEPALRTAEQPVWMARLAAEHGNAAAALEWAVAEGEVELALRLFGSLSWYLLLKGRRGELMTWRRRVLGLVAEAERRPRDRLRALRRRILRAPMRRTFRTSWIRSGGGGSGRRAPGFWSCTSRP